VRFALVILPAAIIDVREAAQWYEDQRMGLGAEFALEVTKAIDGLAEHALLFRVRYRRKNVRWILPPRFPYRICYYVEGQTAYVFAIVHAARHDRKWKRRV
jgi:plasmid stabilization system protein ParE